MGNDHVFACRPYRSTVARTHLKGGYPRPSTLVVDIHCHIHTQEAEELARASLPADQEDFVRFASPETRARNVEQQKERWGELTGVEERLRDMDRMNVDVQVMSPSPAQYYYKAEAETARETSRIINDNIAETVARHPDRLAGLCTVPLQDTDMAIAELDRSVSDRGLRGVEIGPYVAADEVSAQRLARFWARCEDLGIVVFVHPMAVSHGDRLGDHYFTNIIGNPLATTLAVHYLIFDGVLDRHSGLKIVVAHGGGYASHYPARMDHAHGARPDCRRVISKPPTSYMRRLYFDTVVFSPHQLAHLAALYGTDHLLLGTDYPYDMADYDPVELVGQVDGFGEGDRQKICGLNALSLLGLDADRFRR
jgi:aminocarboxymuconate-semialdehyde decarboxylase